MNTVGETMNNGDGGGSIFDYTAPPPPKTLTLTRRNFTPAQLEEAAKALVSRGYIARRAEGQEDARTKAKALSHAVMNCEFWVPQFGEPRPRWIAARATKVDGEWWAYAQVAVGAFAEPSPRDRFARVKVDSHGKRIGQHK
jgi:hypothetical protein